MKKIWYATGGAALLCAFIAMMSGGKAAPGDPSLPLKLEVATSPAALAPRIGVNIAGGVVNLVSDPGFEGAIDRIPVLVADPGTLTFSNAAGHKDPDGYWRGAAYSIYGSMEPEGLIADSFMAGENDLPEYVASEPLPALTERQLLILTKRGGGFPVGVMAAAGLMVEKCSRPGSSGVQSLLLKPEKGKELLLQIPLDEGNGTLQVNGKWRLFLWAKGDRENCTLDLLFKREGKTVPFLSQQVALSRGWEEYFFEFDAFDRGMLGRLKFELAARGPGGASIHLDDLFLGSVGKNGTAFPDELLEDLRLLRPSFIRDFQGQACDTIDNRLADIFARRNFRLRQEPSNPSWSFGYSIPELFDLCEKVGANPWIVVPATSSDRELNLFGEFLVRQAAKRHFSEVCLEFGGPDLAAEMAYLRVKKAVGGRVHLRRAAEKQASEGTGAELARQLIKGMYAQYYPQAAPAGAEADGVVQLFNSALGGSLHRIEMKTSLPVNAAAVRNSESWKALVASTYEASIQVELSFPDDGKELPSRMLLLRKGEEGEFIIEKKVAAVGRKISFILPAWGVVVFPSNYGS